jgi:hypothetical protein
MKKTIEEYSCPNCGSPITAYITQYEDGELSAEDLEELNAESESVDIWDEYKGRFCPGCWKDFERIKTVADSIYGKDTQH